MTHRDRVLQVVAIVLTTLAEVPSAPAGILYSGLMGRFTLDEFTSAEMALVASGNVTKSGHVLTITAYGRETVQHLRLAFAAKGMTI